MKKIKAENEIYFEHRALYVQKQLYKTGIIKDNPFKVGFLQAITESMF